HASNRLSPLSPSLFLLTARATTCPFPRSLHDALPICAQYARRLAQAKTSEHVRWKQWKLDQLPPILPLTDAWHERQVRLETALAERPVHLLLVQRSGVAGVPSPRLHRVRTLAPNDRSQSLCHPRSISAHACPVSYRHT